MHRSHAFWFVALVAGLLPGCRSPEQPARELARVTLAEVVSYQADASEAARILQRHAERREAASRAELAVALTTEARARANSLTRDAAEEASRRTSYRASDLATYLRERSELQEGTRAALAERLAAYEASLAQLRTSYGIQDKKLSVLRQKLEALQGERSELDRVIFLGDALLAVLRGRSADGPPEGATP